MDDKTPDILKKYLDVLDENMDVLSDLESTLDDENEDALTPDMQLHQLYDMAYDVNESAKRKRAESNFMRRQAEDS